MRLTTVPQISEPLSGETAASIADAILGATRSGGDWSSLAAGSQPFACGTVSVPLSLLLSLLQPLGSTLETLLWLHTAYGYLRYGMSLSTEEAVVARLTYGAANGAFSNPREPAWTAQRKMSARTCAICERDAWRQRGRRGVLCDHQLPFVTACSRHGVTLRIRAAGGAPPALRSVAMAKANDVAFSKSSAHIWRWGRDPSVLRQWFANALAEQGYRRGDGTFAVRELGAALAVFVQECVSDARLRRLMEYPLRARQLTGWISGRQSAVHAAYLAVLNMYLRSRSGGPYEEYA
ncbi:hypothetical protein [Cupriavidus sp. UME77]|uniref:hypothetical protein n=1 Tax=Cupriavidus sp. UME77 TaxID=1862321 RepID=UPI0015FFEF0B|nr:hypothetical protein [Cupriavidus sp. UME77]MBB1632457.1 hypothetical protein [Cupriavidus sp. UME77]